jgi:hypothetical protein
MSRIKILLTVVLFLGLVALARAETNTENKKEEEKIAKPLVSLEAKSGTASEAEAEFKKTTEKKTVIGTVAGINPYFLAVDIGVDQAAATTIEITMEINSDTQVKSKKSLKDIANGDTVSVTYEETKATNGKITRVLSRITKEINFIKAAEAIKEQNAMQSEAQEEPAPQETTAPPERPAGTIEE